MSYPNLFDTCESRMEFSSEEDSMIFGAWACACAQLKFRTRALKWLSGEKEA